jgi:hypothetical protein
LLFRECHHGVDVRRNVGPGVAVGADVPFGLAVGSGDAVAVTVVAGVGAGLDAAAGWSTSRLVAELVIESAAEALPRLPKDEDKHKAYNQACGYC